MYPMIIGMVPKVGLEIIVRPNWGVYTLIPQFHYVIFTHTPRVSNRFADALAKLAFIVEIPLGFRMQPLMIEQKVKPACECTFTEEGEDDGKPWYEDMKKILEEGLYPSEVTSKDKMALRKFAT
ncbi:hypothetical protein RHMOL_Rhmol11G0022100 [Rhododendron molle]|uniref:Uncharacterized protein n=1 Tax=Rhododendron molle TaxID=49168 RepID=A0ACC0LNA9_RHOML|nr:hypothetical protein RHMOL_Rhmol11G0022100 [Rhododendron molle]